VETIAWLALSRQAEAGKCTAWYDASTLDRAIPKQNADLPTPHNVSNQSKCRVNDWAVNRVAAWIACMQGLFSPLLWGSGSVDEFLRR
jgi:hypothetical protein